MGLAFARLFIFLGMHYYVKTNSVVSKVLWIFVGMLGIMMAASNIPALVGLAAIILLYVIYKKWKDEDVSFSTKEEDDPFTNFENEWSKIQNKERFK